MNLFIYGSGGFGREVIDLARRVNAKAARWESIFFLDDLRHESSFYGTRVFRFNDALIQFDNGAMEVAIGVGEPQIRNTLAARLASQSIPLASVIDNDAAISETAIIGKGAIISPGCFISSRAVLAENVALVANATVGHDSSIGQNCVLAGSVNLGGFCTVEANAYIGMGSQLRDRIRIGQWSIVGMGSIVYNDIGEELIAMGNPCKALRRNSERRVFQHEGN